MEKLTRESVKVAQAAYGAVVVVDDNTFGLYGPHDGFIMYQNGKKLWKANGVFKSHQVKDGKIYITEQVKKDLFLTIFDVETGKKLWQADTKSGEAFTVCGDKIITNANKTVLCFDTTKAKKNLLWKQALILEGYGLETLTLIDQPGKETFVHIAPVKKTHKYAPVAYFEWNGSLVVPTDANRWFILNMAGGKIEREIEIKHECFGKMHLIVEKVHVDGDIVSFAPYGILTSVNLATGEISVLRLPYNIYAVTKDGRELGRDGRYSDGIFYMQSNNECYLIPAGTKDGKATEIVKDAWFYSGANRRAFFLYQGEGLIYSAKTGKWYQCTDYCTGFDASDSKLFVYEQIGGKLKVYKDE